MLTFLPRFILGPFAFILYILNTAIVPLTALLLALISFLIPIPPLRRAISWFNHVIIPVLWAESSNFIMWLTTKTEWDIQGTGPLSTEGWYLLVSNHQSWLDILVFEKVFIHKVPHIKFFMKRALLITLPIAGLACWALGYPFVTRYSKEYLEKHPEKKGKDLEITRKACEKFKDQPVTIANYVEGTRFTKAKQAAQKSPYHHLLKPRAGGFAFVLSAMQGHLHGILNTTIIYPDPKTNLWQFMCGRTRKIIVRYELLPLSEVPMGDYFNDVQFQHDFHDWLNHFWHKKDQLIDSILNTDQTQVEKMASVSDKSSCNDSI